MIAPQTPPDESTRLKALHDLNLLDTPPEERFDRITRTAMTLFKTPIALISPSARLPRSCRVARRTSTGVASVAPRARAVSAARSRISRVSRVSGSEAGWAIRGFSLGVGFRDPSLPRDLVQQRRRCRTQARRCDRRGCPPARLQRQRVQCGVAEGR